MEWYAALTQEIRISFIIVVVAQHCFAACKICGRYDSLSYLHDVLDLKLECSESMINRNSTYLIMKYALFVPRSG
jgi:hypothetical protein